MDIISNISSTWNHRKGKVIKVNIFPDETLNKIFELLERCRGVEQMDKYHPEGDVLTHLIQTFRCATRETDDVDLALAALVHDVGKCERSKGHESIGCDLLEGYVSIKVLFLVKNHMRIRKYIDGEMHKFSKCLWLANHPWLPELIQLSRWDCKGRNPNRKIKFDINDIIERLNRVAEKHFHIPEYLKGYEGCYGLKEG